MKILMLGWELPPHYVGGMGIVCDQLSRRLASDGADIEFLLPFKADYSHIKYMKVTAAIDQGSSTLMKSGGTYDSMSYSAADTNGNMVVRSLYDQVDVFAASVARIVELGTYDVIHAHDWLTLKAGLEAKRISGLPLFVHIHATEFDRAGGKYGNPIVHQIESMGLRAADHIFAVSNRTKQTLIDEYDIPADKITVTHNVIEISEDHLKESDESFVYLQKMRSLGYKVVLNAGRMTAQKGIYNMLLAARKVVDKMPKTIFMFVGGGEQIPELLEMSADLGLSGNTIFTGRVEGIGREWRDSFRAADLFVMPSVSEPLGLVPLESIAYGAPTLISKQSGISEFLVNTLKVDHWDIDEMASQICAVLDNKDLHDTLLENAQEEYRRLSWEPVSQRILSLYQEVKHRKLMVA